MQTPKSDDISSAKSKAQTPNIEIISSSKTTADSDAPKITRRSVNRPSNKDDNDNSNTTTTYSNNSNNSNRNSIKNDNNDRDSINGTVTKQPFSTDNKYIEKSSKTATIAGKKFQEEEECDRCCPDPCPPEIYNENQKRELMGHESFNMNTNEEYRMKFGLQSEHMRRVHPQDWIIIHANLSVVEPELTLIIQESIDEALAEAAPKRNQKNVLISPSCMVWM